MHYVQEKKIYNFMFKITSLRNIKLRRESLFNEISKINELSKINLNIQHFH